MGRVNRLTERRALRRAADQALLTSLGSPTSSQAGGPADQDFTYSDFEREQPPPSAPPPAYDDRENHDPVTAPIPVIDVPESVLPQSVPPWEDRAHDDPADLYDVVPQQVAEPEWTGAAHSPRAPTVVSAPTPERDDVVVPVAAPSRPRPIAESAYVRPELDFAAAEYREQRWYRTKPAAVVVAVAVIAAVMCGGWFVLRSPGTAAEQSSTEAPTSAPPAPSKAAPTAVSAPNPRPKPAPPPPPPPPPPAEPTYSAPQRQYQPRYSEPTQAEKPRVDVTRAPMSVAPVPKPVPGSDSNTPGDAPGEKPRRRGCFGFC